MTQAHAQTEIMQGDAIALLRDMPSCSVNMVVADPPYNLGKDYGNNHDLKGFDDYLTFSHDWLTEAHRIRHAR
ncbi:MAG TPA: DNA methyltransferase [Ktedonobacterales bacterium]|nr:DNA methyltransferase [Ktedonobacterales bacterium]